MDPRPARKVTNFLFVLFLPTVLNISNSVPPELIPFTLLSMVALMAFIWND